MTEEPYAHVLPNLSPRHVPRPRLTRLLDDARGQTIVLHAPAGYGKTSLAVEWLQERDDVAWFTAQPESGDVGAAVLGVALAASRIVPRAADRVRQRLSVVEEPAQAARTFAEILAEDLADWPSGGIVAIDDYHHLAESDAAESFIDWLLVLRPSLRILVATRRRPSWTSARRVLAGEIVELEKHVLSMTDSEVAAVVGDAERPGLIDLLDKAEGWPAVIGLAALSPAPNLNTAPRIGEELFRYFAEELLRSMNPAERRLALMASVPRSLTPELMAQLESKSTPTGDSDLLSSGLLTETADERFRFHPLVREFLLKQLRDGDKPTLEQVARELLESACDEARWEDAFDASLLLDDLEISADVAGDAATDLIQNGRLETLERWLTACGDAVETSDSAALAQAKVLYHAGRFSAARSLALDVARRGSLAGVDAGRALIVAASATHVMGLAREALDLYLQARERTECDRVRVEAIAGAVGASADLEDDQASVLAEELDAEAAGDRESRIRSFARWVAVDERMGSLENAERLLNALEPVANGEIDPVVHSAAYNAQVHILCAQARFDEALATAAEGRELCETFRLPWARDWIELTSVRALIGSGRFFEARESLATLERPVARTEDAAARFVYGRSQLQLALCDPTYKGAVAQPLDSCDSVPPAIVAEHTAFLALEAAIRRDTRKARRLAADAAAQSRAVEPTCYSKLVLALCGDLEASDSCPSPKLHDAIQVALERRLVEAVVVLARAHRPLALWARRQLALQEALNRARFGFDSDVPDGSTESRFRAQGLTPREIEVLELLASGHTNAEIASDLVISLATAKTHVHRILRKLRVRNRAEATRVYVAERTRERHTRAASQAADASASANSGWA